MARSFNLELATHLIHQSEMSLLGEFDKEGKEEVGVWWGCPSIENQQRRQFRRGSGQYNAIRQEGLAHWPRTAPDVSQMESQITAPESTQLENWVK